MTYFKLLLIVVLSIFLNHCGEAPTTSTDPDNTPSDEEKAQQAAALAEQTAQLSATLKQANCLTGTYTGKLDTTSKFWQSVQKGMQGGDNTDVTVSIANNGSLEDLQVLFLIESEQGSICSSYGGFSATEEMNFSKAYEFTFSSGSSAGKIGTRGSVAPVVSYFVARGEEEKCLPPVILKISDVSNSALTLENKKTSSMRITREDDSKISFDGVKAKCDQIFLSQSAAQNQVDGSAEESN